MASDPTVYSLVVDSSALLAIELKEPGYEELVAKLSKSPTPCIGAPTMFEAAMVWLGRFGSDPRTTIFRTVRDADVEVVAFDEECYEIALAAFQKYGKGRHPAALNLGDCMAYAVSIDQNAPLLFVGDDFSKTDVRRA